MTYKETMKTLSQVTNELAWLGQVISLETMGKYQVACYKEKDFDTKKITERLLYQPYYDGKSFNESFCSLEAALSGCMAFVHDGINSKAGHYFMRMINIE